MVSKWTTRKYRTIIDLTSKLHSAMKSGKNQSSKRNGNSSVTKVVVSAKFKQTTKTSDTKKQQSSISKCTKLDAKSRSDYAWFLFQLEGQNDES